MTSRTRLFPRLTQVTCFCPELWLVYRAFTAMLIGRCHFGVRCTSVSRKSLYMRTKQNKKTRYSNEDSLWEHRRLLLSSTPAGNCSKVRQSGKQSMKIRTEPAVLNWRCSVCCMTLAWPLSKYFRYLLFRERVGNSSRSSTKIGQKRREAWRSWVQMKFSI